MSIHGETFSSRLREERGRLGYSQAQVSEICGVSREVWGRYETGKTMPGADVLLKFTEEGADILYLMTGSRIRHENKMSQGLTTYSREDVDELNDVFAHTNDEGRQALLSLARFIKNK